MPDDYQPSPETDSELLPVVDLDDRQIGVATRAEIHARDLIHRAVHVVLHDGEGAVLVARRSQSKDRFPGWWDVSVGGHVGCGEAYIETARREMAEEMGVVDAEPRLVAVIDPDDDNGWEHIHVFAAGIKRGGERPNTAEIADAVWFGVDDFKTRFVPGSTDQDARMSPAALRSFQMFFKYG